MSTTTLKNRAIHRHSLITRIRIWMKENRLKYLRDEVSVEWSEIERTRARIVALDSEIIRSSHDLAALKLKK